MGEAARRKAASFVAEIDETELTLRLAEIAIGLKRPPGMSAADALRQLRQHAETSGQPEAAQVYESFARMARTACLYFGECIAKGSQPS